MIYAEWQAPSNYKYDAFRKIRAKVSALGRNSKF